MEWEGDWNGIKAWVRTLFPTSVQLPGAEDPDFGFPATVELLAGSRMNLVDTGNSLECGDLEEEDLGIRVRSLVTEYLNTLPDDRIQAYLKLRATRVVDGENEVWTERDFAPRVWTRRAATVLPNQGGVAGTFAALRNVNPTAQPLTAPAPPAPPTGGSWGAAARGQAPVGAPATGGLSDASAAMHTAVGSGEPIAMLAHLMMFTVQTVLSEHRFLIDHNAGLAQQLIGVLDNMARGNAADIKSARKAIEDMYATRMTAEVHRASSERDADVARLTTELGHTRSSLRAMEDRLRVEAQAAVNAAAAAANAVAAAERARASAPAQTDAGMRGRLEEKVANAAERVVEAVIAGAAAQPQQQQVQQQQQQTGMAPAAPSSPINQAASSMAGALGFPGLDVSQVTPEVAAMLLKMLPVETRKAALKTTMMMDPHFGAQFSNEVAEAIDAVVPEEVIEATTPSLPVSPAPVPPAPEGS